MDSPTNLPALRHLPTRWEPLLAADRGLLPTPRRLLRLGTLLGLLSLVLAIAGTAGWALRLDLGLTVTARGPWPLVLTAAFGVGVLAIGCQIVALSHGSLPRRLVLRAFLISLVAPVGVALLALSLFVGTGSLAVN
jgi:hypothetical protein